MCSLFLVFVKTLAAACWKSAGFFAGDLIKSHYSNLTCWKLKHGLDSLSGHESSDSFKVCFKSGKRQLSCFNLIKCNGYTIMSPSAFRLVLCRPCFLSSVLLFSVYVIHHALKWAEKLSFYTLRWQNASFVVILMFDCQILTLFRDRELQVLTLSLPSFAPKTVISVLSVFSWTKFRPKDWALGNHTHHVGPLRLVGFRLT